MRPLFRSDFQPRIAPLKIDPSAGPMLPSTAMGPQEELKQLLARQETLKKELKARKKKLLEAQRRQRDNLKRQIRRAQSRITAAERKRRTRQLILIGSYIDHVTQTDPHSLDRLMKGLDGFLERDRDRELFGLEPQNSAKA